MSCISEPEISHVTLVSRYLFLTAVSARELR